MLKRIVAIAFIFAVTIVCIVTLFVVMQMTARIRWNERFGSGLPRPI